MALDLSALEDKPLPATGDQGAPLILKLADIEEDPAQPRKTFTDEAMAEITESIKARGVKSPVSVKPNPDKPGKWLLNFGARRYRGSLAAGKDTIPAFIDLEHNDYDQVAENLHRDDLKPMELALFIKKKLGDGESKAAIARALRKDSAYITHHLALLDAPAFIEDAYTSGRCTSPLTLYQLRQLHAKFPAQVEEWGATADITRTAVDALAARLKGKDKPTPPEKPIPPQAESLVREQDSTPPPAANKAPTTGTPSGSKPPAASKSAPADTKSLVREQDSPAPPSSSVVQAGVGLQNDQQPDEPQEVTPAAPTSTTVNEEAATLLKPLLMVSHEEQSAVVLLNRRPSQPGLLFIRYEASGEEREVSASSCTLAELTDSAE